MNPTMNPHKSEDEIIEEFIRRHSAIGLDWYVTNLSNTQVGDLIKDRLPIETTRGKILFNSFPLREYFNTSTFELDLATRRVYTFLNPPRRHRSTMPTRGIQLEPPSRKIRE